MDNISLEISKLKVENTSKMHWRLAAPQANIKFIAIFS